MSRQWVGNLNGWTADRLRDYLNVRGVHPLAVQQRHDCVFIDYTSQNEADKALDALNGMHASLSCMISKFHPKLGFI
jgi:hypothetical protein